MCGFAGFLRFYPLSPSLQTPSGFLVAMGEAIAHRGPDDQAYYEDEYLSLVYRRLSIVDVANGQQPFKSQKTGVVLVANGEIYNHLELRKTLGEHHFRSQSDCEVILHLFEEKREKAFEALHGMFAVALWHPHEKKLYLSRDRLGIKPLYVCRTSEGILFGSELKALLAHPACPREADFSQLNAPLCSQGPTFSFIKGIQHVPAATYLTLSPYHRTIIETPFWSLEEHYGSAPFGEKPETYIEALSHLLESTIKSHLQGETPVATHLSGGIDSSLLTCIAARHHSSLRSLSLIERSNFFSHDLPCARGVVEQNNIPWLPLLVNYKTIIPDSHFSLPYLESLVWMMDAPRFDLEWMLKERAHAFLKATHPQTKVVLIGQGADEFSGGYSKRIGSDFNSFSDYLTQEGQQMITLANTEPSKVSRQPTYLNLLKCFIQQLQNHNLWHEDRTSSAHGIEARVPFLDHRIVELLASIPETLHEALFWDKKIWRAVAERQVPELTWNHPKLGFVYGQDARSVDLIKTQLVLKALPDYQEKYQGVFAEAEDEACFKKHLENLRNNTCHQEESADALLQLMSKTIFNEQIKSDTASLWPKPIQTFQPSLPLITPSDWPLIQEHFNETPFNDFTWSKADIPCFAPSSKNKWETAAHQFTFHFVNAAQQTISLGFPATETWRATFLKHLGKGIASNFTVEDWLEELELEESSFLEHLNILTSAGILRHPQSTDFPA